VVRQLSLFSPLIALIVTMLAIVGAPIILGRAPRRIAGIAVVGMLVTLYCVFRAGGMVAGGGEAGLSTLTRTGVLIADNMSIWFQLVLVVFMGGVVWLWWMGSAETERNAPEFFILLMGSAVGMILMVSTTHLLMIILAIELASLPSYAMVGFDKRDPKGAEASLKYVVFGAISAAIMLYGASLLYGLCGSLDTQVIASRVLDQLHKASPQAVFMTYAAIFSFAVGIAFKISAVPFHFWCPDAFEGAKIEVTTWLSVVSKAAGLLLLMRLVLIFCQAVESSDGTWHNAVSSFDRLAPMWWAVGLLATVTCTVGNFAAYHQTSVKRMLAYSSIAHAGYMLMAVAVFLFPMEQTALGAQLPRAQVGVSALLFYVLIYMVMNLGAFGVTAMVIWSTGSDRIESFTGLIRRNPWLAIPMIACLVSLVGLPPLAGFTAKWWLLVALGEMGGRFAWALVVVAVLNTLVSLYYYLRIVVQMTLRDDESAVVRAPIGGVAMVNVCAVLLLAMFVGAQPIKNAADGYARNLFGMPRITTAASAAAVPAAPAILASSSDHDEQASH
jgi:NADH-quinone oxidoreductase subunit N